MSTQSSSSPLAGVSFNTAGIDAVMARLRLDPAFRYADRQIMAMAVAYFACGAHEDETHDAGNGDHHPAYWTFRTNKSQDGGAKFETARRAYMKLVFDLLTMWDRITSGATIMVHTDGTRRPNTAVVPEEVISHVYAPRPIIRASPEATFSVARMVQVFSEGVGPDAIRRWDMLTNRAAWATVGPPPEPRHPSPRLIPNSNTTHYVFHGRVPGTLEPLIDRVRSTLHTVRWDPHAPIPPSNGPPEASTVHPTQALTPASPSLSSHSRLSGVGNTAAATTPPTPAATPSHRAPPMPPHLAPSPVLYPRPATSPVMSSRLVPPPTTPSRLTSSTIPSHLGPSPATPSRSASAVATSPTPSRFGTAASAYELMGDPNDPRVTETDWEEQLKHSFESLDYSLENSKLKSQVALLADDRDTIYKKLEQIRRENTKLIIEIARLRLKDMGLGPPESQRASTPSASGSSRSLDAEGSLASSQQSSPKGPPSVRSQARSSRPGTASSHGRSTSSRASSRASSAVSSVAADLPAPSVAPSVPSRAPSAMSHSSWASRSDVAVESDIEFELVRGPGGVKVFGPATVVIFDKYHIGESVHASLWLIHEKFNARSWPNAVYAVLGGHRKDVVDDKALVKDLVQAMKEDCESRG